MLKIMVVFTMRKTKPGPGSKLLTCCKNRLEGSWANRRCWQLRHLETGFGQIVMPFLSYRPRVCRLKSLAKHVKRKLDRRVSFLSCSPFSPWVSVFGAGQQYFLARWAHNAWWTISLAYLQLLLFAEWPGDWGGLRQICHGAPAVWHLCQRLLLWDRFWVIHVASPACPFETFLDRYSSVVMCLQHQLYFSLVLILLQCCSFKTTAVCPYTGCFHYWGALVAKGLQPGDGQVVTHTTCDVDPQCRRVLQSMHEAFLSTHAMLVHLVRQQEGNPLTTLIRVGWASLSRIICHPPACRHIVRNISLDPWRAALEVMSWMP